MKTLIGKKLGMSQLFTEKGEVLPVTIIQAGPCYVTSVKTQEKFGYSAVQLGFEELKKVKNLSKPYSGIFSKLGIPPQRYLKEFRFKSNAELSGYEVGKQLDVSVFSVGDYVDVQGKSKGRGFSGVMKRHNFSGQPASHGASDRERAPGSSGRQGQRVIKGIKKAGRYGGETTTIQRLEVVGIDKEKNFLFVKGAVPGPNRSVLYIRNTVKKVRPKVAPPPPKKKVQVAEKKKK